ncbi:MAG: DUF4831 family protein [Muribaculaceae bacterium]|nr:DUF4831 family protein [Muribaculaceae bacterium]
MKKFLTAAAAVLSIMSSGAQTTQRLDASKLNEYGLIYTLPVTGLEIYVEVEHTVAKPGEFYNYARRYLNITDAITEPSHTIKVKSVNVLTRGVADPSNRWLAQFKSGSTPFMILNGSGIPLALNTDEVAEIARPSLPEAVSPAPTALEVPAADQAVTREMTMSTSTARRAELAAQRIFELRQMRSDLISGQADNTPPDGKSLELALDNLQAQEAALTAMFAGTISTYTTVDNVMYEPDTEDFSGAIIARVNSNGLTAGSDLTGEPLYMSMEVLERGKLPVNERGEEKRFPKGGVAYNIPGEARFTISFRGNTLYQAPVALAQLGVTFGLDPGLFTDKKAPSMLQWDPSTGGIILLGPAGQQ